MGGMSAVISPKAPGTRDPIRVLMIEDAKLDAELSLRELKRAGLHCIGLRVETEDTLREALNHFRPNVILSDFSMPHFDGMSGLMIVREVCPDVPFIFLSGTIGEEYAIRALKNGAFDYVLKSNLVRLPPAVERALKDAELRVEQRRVEQLRLLEHAVTRGLAEAETESAALTAAMRSVCELGEWQMGTYSVPDASSGVMRVDEAWGIDDPVISNIIATARGREMRMGDSLSSEVLLSNAPVWREDIHQGQPPSYQNLLDKARIKSALGFPVQSNGRTLGVLVFSSRRARQSDEQMLNSMRAVGSQIGQFLLRKRVEEQQRRFRVAMDASADMIALIDRASMRFLDVNSTMCELLGYSREELLSMGAQDILGIAGEELRGEDLQGRRDQFGDPADGAAPVPLSSGISSYRCNDGSRLPVESTRRVIVSAGQRIIVAISRDIRHRMAAEEALRKSNERFNLAVRATNDVVWDWDIARDELWWNENLTATFQYGRDEIGRDAAAWYDLIHPEDRQRIVSTLHRSLALGGDTWSDEYRLRRRDGSYAFIFDRGHIIRNAQGKALRVIGAKADVTARKEAEERLSYLAQFDILTSLPNRHLFCDRLGQMLVQVGRTRAPLAVLFVDLDRFKQVNDTLGHAVGDKLLKEAARRLTACVRRGDSVGRFGGDEFVVLLSDLSQVGDSRVVAQKIIDALAQPFLLDGRQAYVSASIGITLYPNDGEEADTLIANADTAMYRAKEEGRNNFQFFTPEMNARAHKRMQTENALRGALDRREFELHYQPKVDRADGEVCGFEALLRWNRPGAGLVSPAEFIPVLEDTGLIVPVGEWIIAETCRQLAAWRRMGLPTPPVAVNLSARQFQDDLRDSLNRILTQSGVDAQLLQFEITESLLMKDPEGATRILQDLKHSGATLSVDDFGTGYSSLAYLKRFPLDALKIDRAFVRDVTADADDAAIALAIIGLAHSLGLKVIAEGVETEAQMKFLRANGCDQLQGFYFSRPLAVEDATRLLVERRRLEV
jgi:diguanylate cyclase (GGDEF)-like protein/PAS domain S-box-containing protein